jgi:hypothetical protein
MRRLLLSALLFAVVWTSMKAQESPAVVIPAAFEGVFQSIPNDARTPGGLRNEGSPEELVLHAPITARAIAAEGSQDPEERCEPLGPFRMMAREGIRMELVPVPAVGTIVMLFEDIARGYFRTIYLNGAAGGDREPAWQGWSAGRFAASNLVVETTGFNEKTWLDGNGTQPSADLRLVEQIRPVENGQYLEYRITAVDPKVLAKPHTYIRYFQRTRSEIGEHICAP